MKEARENREELARKVGTRIRTRRISLGRSQKTLAASLGIVQSQVSEWENGEVLPSEQKLTNLASALGVTVKYLMTGLGEEAWELGEIFETRAGFWQSSIAEIIERSQKFVVLDSFQGHKQDFWRALKNRLQDPEEFHLTYLILRSGNPFLESCLKVIGYPDGTSFDIQLIEGLERSLPRSSFSKNKKLEFLYWEGTSPGPMMSWTKAGVETIALGLWLNLPNATDGLPYIVVRGGHLFDALKRHYETLIKEANDRNDFIRSP
jgi:transcriptional regulator with XRE-family HTH domain